MANQSLSLIFRNKKKIISLIFFIVIVFIIGRQIINLDFGQNYNFNSYKDAYEDSQYTGGKGLIPDQAVYRYAAGAYMQGASPLKINPETPPLGKYILALSVLLFKNTTQIIVFSAVLTLVILYALSKQLLKESYLALGVVFLFALEELFLNQLLVSPLLDIVQLPFILLSFYFFYKASVSNHIFYYVAAGLCLGFVIGTKTMITGILIIITWLVYIFIKKNYTQLIKIFLISFPVSFVVLLLSYTRIFVDGNTIRYFFAVQKWIFFYQQSKLQFPFSVWQLIFFNRWQTWWGDYRILQADDWSIMWPIITLLSFLYIGIKIIKKKKWHALEMLCAIWVVVYSIFLSLGTVSSRYFLPFFPFLYLLSGKFLTFFVKSKYENSN